jgi:hypothetical protein
VPWITKIAPNEMARPRPMRLRAWRVDAVSAQRRAVMQHLRASSVQRAHAQSAQAFHRKPA